MANPQVMLEHYQSFLKRNNPVDAIVRSVTAAIENVVTFQSKMKLLKYKYALAQQQLRLMETHLNQGSPYDIKGNKIDKPY